jgi:uncharacterized membrane protein
LIRRFVGEFGAVLAARPSILLLPALAFTFFQLRTLLRSQALGAAPYIGHVSHAMHRIPSPRAIVPFALGHVQILPAVGGFALLIIVEGAIVWRARRDAVEMSEPRAKGLGEPRVLAWVWVGVLALYLAGMVMGAVLGNRPGRLVPLLTSGAVALTQALFTAQVLTFWSARNETPALGWADAVRRAALSIQGLFFWELLLFVLVTGCTIAEVRFLSAAGAGVLPTRLVRGAIFAVLAVRAAFVMVPVILVVEGCSLGQALARCQKMWRAQTGWMLGLAGGAFLIFLVYPLLGAALEQLTASAAGPQLLHIVLGYGALILHLVIGFVLLGVYRERLRGEVA